MRCCIKLLVLTKGIEDTKKQLEEKYGSINIDLETGTYTDIS